MQQNEPFHPGGKEGEKGTKAEMGCHVDDSKAELDSVLLGRRVKRQG